MHYNEIDFRDPWYWFPFLKGHSESLLMKLQGCGLEQLGWIRAVMIHWISCSPQALSLLCSAVRCMPYYICVSRESHFKLLCHSPLDLLQTLGAIHSVHALLRADGLPNQSVSLSSLLQLVHLRSLLSRSWKCELHIFGQKRSWCYIFRFLQLRSLMEWYYALWKSVLPLLQPLVDINVCEKPPSFCSS